jgi:hypothetical protein
MQTSLTLHKARFREIRWLLAAFLLVFALGSASGFVIRALTTPTAASDQPKAVVRVTELCPSGSHVVVWYSVQAWGCVSDEDGAAQK